MELIIKCLSDVCVGNGTGLGSLVDTDTCHDRNGLPYIPSRRIKGLLREAALELRDWGGTTDEEIEDLFGTGGEGFSSHKKMMIYDAQIEEYQEYYDDIQAHHISPTVVMDCFTDVRYQTSMEEETKVAKENSLRSTRVVKKGTTFKAEIANCENVALLTSLCRMVRHMGLNRTRGFGEVKFSLNDRDNQGYTKPTIQLDPDQSYRLVLNVKNDSPLMISSQKDSSTINYINGASLLGYFAGKYLKDHPADQRFNDLFIHGLLKFHNAYLSTPEYDELIPNPLSLNKIKDTKILYDRLLSGNKNNNQQLSRISDKYFDMKTKEIYSVRREMIYHHRRPEDKSIGHVIDNTSTENGTFFQMQVISPKQYFKALIDGQGKDLNDLLPYLDSFMTLGKSKGVQYGKTSIMNVGVEELKDESFDSDDVIVMLLSPAVVLDKNYSGSLMKEDLFKEIGRVLDLSLEDIHIGETAIGNTVISGYNAKWNLPRDNMNAFKEGSIIHLTGKTYHVPRECFIGENNQEGLGYVRFYDRKEILLEKKESVKSGEQSSDKKKTKIYTHDLYLKLITEILNKVHKLGNAHLNATTVGKLLLMLQQAGDYATFKEKYITDIKDKNKNKEVKRIVNKLEEELQLEENHYFKELKELANNSKEQANNSKEKESKVSIDVYLEFALKEYLINNKYSLRGGEDHE